MSTKTPECWASDPQARGLRIEVTPERSLLLPHNHFIFAELDSGGDEQNLKLVFTTHEISVRGHHLRRIETVMQRLELSLLAKLPSNQRKLITEGQPVILEIVVTEAKSQESPPQMAQSEQTVGWENSSNNLRLVHGEDKNGLRFFGSRYRLGEKIPICPFGIRALGQFLLNNAE